MSLFYTSFDIQKMTNPRKRKVPVDNTVVKEKYSCDFCNDQYDSETDVHIHRKSKHRLEVNKMLIEEDAFCKSCLRKYDSQESLMKHIKTVHLLSSEDSKFVEREIFMCDICHLIYFNKKMLTVHMQYSHIKATRHYATAICPKCHRIIHIKNAWFHFQRHMVQSLATCQICFKKCKNRKSLHAHLQTHPCHYRCNICQYHANNKKNFDAHMETHDNGRNLKSSDTIKCFIPLIISKRVSFNTGTWGFKLYDLTICVLCRAICTKEDLSTHVSRYHVVLPLPEVKKPVCLCGESFFNNILLRHHVFKMKSDSHGPCQ